MCQCRGYSIENGLDLCFGLCSLLIISARLEKKSMKLISALRLYTEDVGLPYFDRAAVTANGYW